MELHYRYRLKPESEDDRINIRGVDLTKDWHLTGNVRYPVEFDEAAQNGVIDLEQVETDTIYRGDEDWTKATPVFGDAPVAGDSGKAPKAEPVTPPPVDTPPADVPPPDPVTPPKAPVDGERTPEAPVDGTPADVTPEAPVATPEAPAPGSDVTNEEPKE